MANRLHDSQLSLRVPQSLVDRVAEIATYHGRSSPAEVRLALDAHCSRSTLAYLSDDSAAFAELGDGLAEVRERIERDLHELEARLYRTPMAPSLN